MEKFKIIYDETEEDCPILELDGKTEIYLFRGYYFESSKNSHGKLHEWKDYTELESSQVSNYLFSEIIPAFADSMDDLHELMLSNKALLEEFINASLEFYSRKSVFSAEQLDLTKDSITMLPYKNQLYLRAYAKSYDLNLVAIKYLVSEDLPSTYRYLQDYKAEIDAGINEINEINHTLFGLEQVLFTMDKDFKSKIRLCDASGLRYLILSYVDFLNDKAIGRNRAEKLNAF